MSSRPTHAFIPGLLLGMTLLASFLVAAPASAATWTKVVDLHGAKLQACKVPLESGWRVRLRLANNSDHGHLAGATARRDDGTVVDRVQFKVTNRRTSKVKSLVIKPGQVLSTGMAEASGDGAFGGTVELGTIRRC